MLQSNVSRALVASAALLGATAASQATIVINLGAELLQDEVGTALPAGSLLQLVNLGPDGLFTPISVLDGAIVGDAQWVSGDDTLLALAYTTSGGPADFPSTNAFDLSFGTDTPGSLARDLGFATNAIPFGTKLGLRWFPDIAATAFSATTLRGGEFYGQFTRQVNPQNGGVVWTAPADGGNVLFDPLLTTSAGGTDPSSLAQATNRVVPEPTTALSLLLGVAVLARRRRA